MAQDDETFWKAAAGAIAVGVLMLGAALLGAVLRSLPQLLAWWVILVLQLFLVVVAITVGIAGGVWLLRVTFTSLVDRIAELERNHAKLLAELRRRTPAAIATALLIGQAVLLLADKSFDGELLPTVSVSLVLLIAFWVANELQSLSSFALRIVGWVLWLGALAYLPAAIMIFRGWSVTQLVTYFSQFSTGVKLFSLMATTLLVLAPFAVALDRRDA